VGGGGVAWKKCPLSQEMPNLRALIHLNMACSEFCGSTCRLKVLATYAVGVVTVYNRSTTGRQVVDLLPWPQLRLD
jgi:hypothetical protein